MTEQEVYYKRFEALFLKLYQMTPEEYLARIAHRFELAYYSPSDCAASVHYALEHETIKAERQADCGE